MTTTSPTMDAIAKILRRARFTIDSFMRDGGNDYQRLIAVACDDGLNAWARGGLRAIEDTLRAYLRRSSGNYATDVWYATLNDLRHQLIMAGADGYPPAGAA